MCCCVQKQVRGFGISEGQDSDDTSSSDGETRICTMEVETTTDDVSFRHKIHDFNLQTKYSKFLSRERQRDKRIVMPQCTKCFALSGMATNLFAFEFLQKDRIEPIYDHELFKDEQELSTFLQNIHATHAISIENSQVHGYGSAITDHEWDLLASSLNLALKEVCE